MKSRTLRIRHTLFLGAFLFGIFGVSWGQQQNVFSRSDAGTGLWWHSNNPWYYASWANNQNRPDNNSNTRNFVKIGHNNNTSMTTNGAFFTLASLDFESGASAPRTIAADASSSGLSFTIGIYNSSTGTHTFSTNIGVDAATVSFQNNNIGGMVFSGNFYLNSNTADFGGAGSGNFDISAILSGSNGKVVKNGTNSLVLSGANTYTGLTTINAGILQLNKSGGGTLPSGNSITVNNGGTLRISSNQTLADLTINSGGTVLIDAGVQLTITGTLTNNGTFTLENGATFKQGASVTGGGTYNIKQNLDNCSNNGTSLTGRYWYLGSPVTSLRENSFGNAGNLNKVWSFTNGAYTAIGDGATLVPTTGYVHRRGTNASPLTFTGTNLYATDETIQLSNNAGTYGGWHLIANPYTAYLDWQQVAGSNLSSNLSNTYYIRSYNASGSGDVNALISYNSSTGLESNTSSLSLTSAQAQYIAPMQAIWVKVNPTTPLSATAGQLRLERAFTSHQTGNVGLKSSTIFPTLARVNLVDGGRFDQMLVFMNQDMSNGVDQFDSEKMFVSGAPQIYTMAAGKKLVMNGLKNNKKKISIPLYLELPQSKVYNLQLADFNLEAGLILLEDKQEGTIQDFTIHDVYSFYANSGIVQNRFVLHFFMPDATITAQGPSNSWVAEEGSYTEGGNVQITADSKGKVQISLDQPETDKIEGSVQVTDANGRIVHSGALEGLTTLFELNVPTGIYYLTVQSGHLIENKKLFIQD